MLDLGLKLGASVLAATAMYTDLRTRRIPNALSAALAALALAHALVLSVMPGVLECAIVLVVGLVLFACRAMGGGDVKFMGACALMLPGKLAAFAFWTALLGGALALAVLGLKTLKKTRDATLPYGVAIALAFLACLWLM